MLPEQRKCEECAEPFISIILSKTRFRTRFCGESCRWKNRDRKSGEDHLKITKEEQAIASAFIGAELHFRVMTGRRTRKNVRHFYEIDIAFPWLKLAVEIDGGIHRIAFKRKADAKRTEELNTLGWQVLRFSKTRVREELDLVIQDIASTISRLTITHRTA